MPAVVPALMGCGLLALAVASGAGSAQMPRPEPPEPGTGAISGVVLDATTRQPVADALVSIQQRPGAVTNQFDRQVTDARGRFVFTGLAAWNGYRLSAQKHGYLAGGFGREAPDAPVKPIALGDGEWRSDVTLLLFRPAVVSGSVVDEASEPVVGAIVRALTRIHIGGQPQFVEGPIAMTDDRGMFRISDLTPGEYAVMVPSVQWSAPSDTSAYDLSGTSAQAAVMAELMGRPNPVSNRPALPAAPGHVRLLGDFPTPPPTAVGRRQVYPPTYFAGARSPDEAALISLSTGEERTGLTITLTPEPSAKVAGRVIGPPEAFAGLVLRLMPEGAISFGIGSEAATALVAPDGSFTFPDVPRGAYDLLASPTVTTYSADMGTSLYGMPRPPGMRFSGSSGTAVPGRSGIMLTTLTGAGRQTHFGQARLQVGDADLTGVQIALRRGVSVSGRLITEGLDRALPAFSVAAEPAGGSAALGRRRGRVDRNDPAMRFRIEGLLWGEYVVRPSPGGLVKSVMWNGRDHTDVPFDTSNGEDIEGVVITTTTEGARITGTARDEANPQTSDVAVICFPVEPERWRRYGLRSPRIRSVTVSTSGEYSIGSLPAGEYYVIAVDETLANAWVNPEFLAAAAPLASRVTVDWGDVATAYLEMTEVRIR